MLRFTSRPIHPCGKNPLHPLNNRIDGHEIMKVQYKEVKNTTSLLSVIMLLIERHQTQGDDPIE